MDLEKRSKDQILEHSSVKRWEVEEQPGKEKIEERLVTWKQNQKNMVSFLK